MIIFIVKILTGLSFAILSTGIITVLWIKKNRFTLFIAAYLFFMLLSESIAFYMAAIVKEEPVVIFTLSFFVHFSFLTFLYNKEFFQSSSFFQNILIAIGLLPLLLHLTTNSNLTWLQPYARIPYSLIITLYSLGYFYALVRGKIATNYPRDLLNTAILLFFGIDTFLATGTPYLIKREYLQIVAWFWFFRALLLQSFYIALIYFGWKSSQNTGPSS